ncbi:hypothetical protein PRK78_004856 [Emydomyces testavorans]|uniref:Cyclin-D1-binding protein 1-like N-terminal domain-containing protein n=1 Tax=Emydomyces testavorans TaxID=2070801 RepID=A0AAF0DIP1_9EURO|nr:hypothetical protein PRK78_004856 [Emydomyces testavorans]
MARLSKILETTVALSEQFIISLSSPAATEPTPSNSIVPSEVLPLLSASAQALKSQTTKLSLLAINTPFTPSAIISVLSDINESVLPSLVTAALLLTPRNYTQTFYAEAKTLVKDALRELTALTHEVGATAEKYDRNTGFKLSEEDKHGVTTATGRVWKVCDQIGGLVSDGVVGLVIRKAREYLELVQDGIRELKEWDPEEELDDDDDDDGLWGDEFGNEEDDEVNGGGTGKGKAILGHGENEEEEEEEEEQENQRAKLDDEKKYLLRLLTLVSQLYTAIISHRLKNLDQKTSLLPKSSLKLLDSLVSCLHDLPNLVDEAAGSLYEHNIEYADAYSLKLRDRASEAVQMLRQPWTNGDVSAALGENAVTKEAEDKFSKWASVWVKVVDDLTKDKESG